MGFYAIKSGGRYYTYVYNITQEVMFTERLRRNLRRLTVADLASIQTTLAPLHDRDILYEAVLSTFPDVEIVQCLLNPVPHMYTDLNELATATVRLANQFGSNIYLLDADNQSLVVTSQFTGDCMYDGAINSTIPLKQRPKGFFQHVARFVSW